MYGSAGSCYLLKHYSFWNLDVDGCLFGVIWLKKYYYLKRVRYKFRCIVGTFNWRGDSITGWIDFTLVLVQGTKRIEGKRFVTLNVRIKVKHFQFHVLEKKTKKLSSQYIIVCIKSFQKTFFSKLNVIFVNKLFYNLFMLCIHTCACVPCLPSNRASHNILTSDKKITNSCGCTEAKQFLLRRNLVREWYAGGCCCFPPC